MFAAYPYNGLMVSHGGQPSSRALSPNIWSRGWGQAASPTGTHNLKMVGDDFLTFGGTVAANVGTYHSQAGFYTSFEDTSSTLAQVATSFDGVITATTPATDDKEVWIQPGGTASVLTQVSSTAGSDKMMLFEARVKFSSVANSTNYLVGLGEEGMAVENTIADAATLVSKDYVGFAIFEDAGTSLKVVYRKAGQAMQTLFTYGTAIAADTYYKLGMLYDPAEVASKRIKFFVDGVEQTTYITNALLTAATFPDGEELNFLMGVKNGSAAAKSISCDWWAVASGG